MTPEGFVKKAIMEFLSYQRNCAVFPVATAGMFDPTTNQFRKSPMKKGTPDIFICWQGRFVAIEVKSPKGVVSDAQVERLGEIDRAGGIAIVARSVQDVVAAVKAAGLKL